MASGQDRDLNGQQQAEQHQHQHQHPSMQHDRSRHLDDFNVNEHQDGQSVHPGAAESVGYERQMYAGQQMPYPQYMMAGYPPGYYPDMQQQQQAQVFFMQQQYAQQFHEQQQYMQYMQWPQHAYYYPQQTHPGMFQSPNMPQSQHSGSQVGSPPGLNLPRARSDEGISNTDDGASATESTDHPAVDGTASTTPLTSAQSSTSGADDAFFKGLLEGSSPSVRMPPHQQQSPHPGGMPANASSNAVPHLANVFAQMNFGGNNQQPPRYGMHPHAQAPMYPRPQFIPNHRMISLLTEQVKSVVASLRPSKAEMQKKEELRHELEMIVKKTCADAKLEKFGSMGNGFAVANSDMDLCLLTDQREHSASEYVEILGEVIKQETEYEVLTLPKARVPIIKLSRGPTDAHLTGIQIDIGFNNRVALVNTKLLDCYRQVDPRLEEMVLFIKYWVKRRRINHPHSHTLSSYTYVLMIIYFLQMQEPPVLPNLQQLPIRRSLSLDDIESEEGFQIAFFDDVNALKEVFTTQNNRSVGMLLYDFFQHFATEFRYSTDVVSIRSGGVVSKESKGWTKDVEHVLDEDTVVKDRYRFAVEDPFETSHNTARTVNREGLFVIRGEFLRATKRVIGKGDWRTMVERLCELKTEEDEEARLKEARARFLIHRRGEGGDGEAFTEASIAPAATAEHHTIVGNENGDARPLSAADVAET